MKKNAPRRVQQKIDIESEPSRACLQASRKPERDLLRKGGAAEQGDAMICLCNKKSSRAQRSTRRCGTPSGIRTLDTLIKSQVL